ncbi:MAG: hypothetical protein OZ933_06900 [Chloroflexota bacterium]|nr:MAG: hypothetical protein UZ13_00560 [Chloroflexi bacterium OLB13]MEB2365800.1 hypothetical protein [Chloroflexota bacterium]
MRLLRPNYLNVAIPAESVARTLEAAATPSAQRLHMRDAFAEGRRYAIAPSADGFRMATTSSSLFSRRRRTFASCLLNARIEPITESESRISLEPHLRAPALISALIVPTVLSLLLLPVPWPPALILLICATAYAASITSLLAGARLEAHEMLYFVDKAFEDMRKFTLAQIAPIGQDVIGAQDFRELWSEHVRTNMDDT